MFYKNRVNREFYFLFFVIPTADVMSDIEMGSSKGKGPYSSPAAARIASPNQSNNCSSGGGARYVAVPPKHCRICSKSWEGRRRSGYAVGENSM